MIEHFQCWGSVVSRRGESWRDVERARTAVASEFVRCTDVVVELSDGRWATLEVKLSEDKVDEDTAAKLLHVASKLTSNPREQVRSPAFLAFIVGKGGRAYRRTDGIYV